jgi:hypothetical protein
MTYSTSRALVVAALAFTVALFVFGSALVRALASDAVTEPPAPPSAADTTDGGEPAERRLSSDALMLAVENDPFQPDRSRPAARYRLPGDVDPPPPPPPPPPPALPDFRVTGTAVMPDGGIAVLGIGDAPPRVLAIGEYLGGYMLAGVTSETATMKNDEREITLLVPGPSARPAAAAAAAAATRGPGAGAARGMQQGRQAAPPPPNPREQALQAEVLDALLRRAQADGATPQMLQAIERMIQQRGIQNIGTMDIQIQNGTMTIGTRTPPDTSSTPRTRRP